MAVRVSETQRVREKMVGGELVFKSFLNSVDPWLYV